jgi:hypothetical protein
MHRAATKESYAWCIKSVTLRTNNPVSKVLDRDIVAVDADMISHCTLCNYCDKEILEA